MGRIINLKFFIFLLFLPTCYLLSTIYPLYAEDKIVAIVNNEVVTQKDLDDFLNFMSMQLSREFSGKALEEKITSMKADLLERLIEDRLILQEARKEKVTPDENRVKSKINEVKKRYKSDADFQGELAAQGLTQADIASKIREQFLMYAIVEMKVRSKITVWPDEITNYYNANKAEFKSGKEREFEVFALENEDLAKSFAYYLKIGRSAEELARRYPFTVNKLSVFEGEQLKKEIEGAVAKIGINEVSDAVKIDDKCYVFRLKNIIPSKELSLREVQNKIQAFLFDKKMQEALTKWLDELKNQSYIKIN